MVKVDFTLRLPEKLLQKIKELAKKEKRSTNKEIEYIVEQYLVKYEKQHGEIET